jgi:hypothetical protein
MTYNRAFEAKKERRGLGFGLVALALAVMTGCGGGMSNSVPPPPLGGNPPLHLGQADAKPDWAQIQLRSGDNQPVERFLSLQVTLNSIRLEADNGNTVELLTSPITVEQANLAVVLQSAGLPKAPAGNYTSMRVGISGAKAIYADNFGNLIQQQVTPPSPTVAVALGKGFSVAALGSAISSLSLDIPASVALDGIQGTLAMKQPAFTLGTTELVSTPANQDKLLEHFRGVVAAVAGSTIQIQDQNGVTLSVLTDGNTFFSGLTLDTAVGMNAEAELNTQADGTLLASKVEALGDGNGAVIVGTVADNDDVSAKVAVQEALGQGTSADLLGVTAAIDLSQAVTFKMDSANIDMTGLDFTLDVSSLVPGQRVQFLSSHAIQQDPNGSAGLLQADTVEIEPQTISGKVTNITTDSNGYPAFDLALPDDSGSLLSVMGPGTMMVHVITQSLAAGTNLIADGATVKVRGLLLYNAPRNLGSRPMGPKVNVARRPPTLYTLIASRLAQ